MTTLELAAQLFATSLANAGLDHGPEKVRNLARQAIEAAMVFEACAAEHQPALEQHTKRLKGFNV